MMGFIVDERITSTCFELGDWSLSRLFLKNNANYPWLILVPRQIDIQELHQLPTSAQHELIEEVGRLSSLVNRYFLPDKLNVGALGNIVSQLHIHVIARFKDDALWPHGVWQAAQIERPYTHEELDALIHPLRCLVEKNR
jgi:diadenosine tetraphosphate (Ap4A) HIT family hydrolase